MKHRPILALGVVICLLMSGIVHAQYLPNDTTISDNRFSGGTFAFIAGYSGSTDEALHQNGTSPTITIVDGAFFTGFGVGKSGSTINMSGGTAGSLSALENATVNLSGGLTSGLNAGGGIILGTPKANMTGGVATGVAAQGNGLLTVTGGQILSSVQLFDSGVAKISSTTIGQTNANGNLVVTLFDVRNQSSLELSGATVGAPSTGAIQLFNTAKAKLTDTSLLGSVLGFGQNTVEVTGGNISGSVVGFNVKINDGTVGGASVQGDGATGTISGTHAIALGLSGTGSTMSVTGSTITDSATVFTGGVLTASGTTFGGTVSASGSSAGPATIGLSGGSAGNVAANIGVITATDVTIAHDVTAQASGVGLLGSITLNGGTVGGNVSATGNLSAIPNALVRINGSHITGSVTANTRSAITLVSGTVGGDVAAKVGPITLMDVQGGTISGNAVVINREVELRMSGGTVNGDVRASNRGTANISAGTVGGNLSSDRAFVNLSGGTVQGKWIVTNFGSGTQSGGSVLGDAQLAGVDFTMTGGSIAKDVSIEQSCIFTMQNGTIGQTLFSKNQGRVDMSGGQVGTLGATEQSTVGVRGGVITGVAEVADTATLNVSGTAIFNDQLNAFVGSTVNFSGGSAKSVGIVDQATLNLSGSALILDDLSAFDTATVNLNGGKVIGDLLANDSSVIAMAAGEVLDAVTEEQSTLVVQGGAIKGNLIAHNSSVIRLNGGSVSGSASSQDQSTLVVEGTPLIGGGIQARNNSKLFIKGGGINGDAVAHETATLTLSGSGFVSGKLASVDTATVNMNGGGVGSDAGAQNNAKFVLSAGNVAGNLLDLNNGEITMTGGSVGGDLRVENNARLLLSGGNVAGELVGFNNADITMTGGTVGSIQMSQDQPGHGISIGGGHVTGNVNVFNSAGVLLIAGTVGGDINAQGNSLVEIESIAAVAGSLNAFDASIVNVRGGSIGLSSLHGNLQVLANATLNLSGGTVGGDLQGFNDSTINMSGGTVFGRGIFSGNSKFNFTGGKVLGGIFQPPGLSPSNGPALRVAANEVLNITALDNATINIQGVDLVATLIDPNHQGTSSLYQLSGLLADGTSISGGSMVIQNGTAATFGLTIVPHWTADADGNWSNQSNWVQGIPNAPGAVARFLNKITADRTITVDGNFTVGQMVFNDTDHYTLAGGGSITLQGPAPMINVVGGTHQINAPLLVTGTTEIQVANSATLNLQGNLSIPAAAALTKTGDGTLRVAGPQSHEPNSTLAVSTGTLNLASNAGTPAQPTAAASANLTLNINSTVILDSPQDLGGLSLSIANEGNQSLDLHSNALRIYSPDLAAAKASLWAAIQNANTNPLDGIFDSTRASHPGSALGIAQIADAHGDQHIEMRLTRVGDLNLDGTVTIGDFIDLASHFNSTNATWQEGDVNYDGAVTIGDFIDLVSNFNTTFAGESFPISVQDQQALTAFAASNGVSAVPEPSSSLALAAALLLLPRRRFRGGHGCAGFAAFPKNT